MIWKIYSDSSNTADLYNPQMIFPCTRAVKGSKGHKTDKNGVRLWDLKMISNERVAEIPELISKKCCVQTDKLYDTHRNGDILQIHLFTF